MCKNPRSVKEKHPYLLQIILVETTNDILEINAISKLVNVRYTICLPPPKEFVEKMEVSVTI